MKELLAPGEALSFGPQQWSVGISAGHEIDRAWSDVQFDQWIARTWKRSQLMRERQRDYAPGKKPWWEVIA